MNSRYNDSWKSERPQNTTCSYFTGTTVYILVNQKSRAARTDKLTVLRKQVVRSPNNELCHESTKFLQLLLAFFLDFVRRIRIAATNDGILEILPEIAFGSKEVGIRKVKQRKIFREIILDRCSREDDPTLDVEAVERLECQGFYSDPNG
jgi:hypothetical protein